MLFCYSISFLRVTQPANFLSQGYLSISFFRNRRLRDHFARDVSGSKSGGEIIRRYNTYPYSLREDRMRSACEQEGHSQKRNRLNAETHRDLSGREYAQHFAPEVEKEIDRSIQKEEPQTRTRDLLPFRNAFRSTPWKGRHGHLQQFQKICLLLPS